MWSVALDRGFRQAERPAVGADLQQGYFNDHKDARIVCTVTGHGLKDPNIAIKNVVDPVVLEADIKEVLREIGL